MSISIFELFRVGIGPSSSHTVGPMRAAKSFIDALDMQDKTEATQQVQVILYGSLSSTGVGHGIEKAIVAGLEGGTPNCVDVDTFCTRIDRLQSEKTLNLNKKKTIDFDLATHLVFSKETLDFHVNGMEITARDTHNKILLQKTYFSVGGGFVVEPGEKPTAEHLIVIPHPFKSGDELLKMAQAENKSIAQIVLENERMWRSDVEIDAGIELLWNTMKACVERGLSKDGILPGGLKVRRRAKALHDKMQGIDPVAGCDNPLTMRWLNIFAMAVSEENADYGRIVTAPTNGAAGIIPSVLYYLSRSRSDFSHEMVKEFLLTAGGIGILYKENASISGAEVGCQGEVGVACSMASGGLTQVLGGSAQQVENAAEIGMEHHLGLTCDPIAGLVQIPCIERNAIAAVKAVNIAHLAIMEDGVSKVSLDQVIATMLKTGQDMLRQYKETSEGGLAVNVIEC